MGGRHFGNVFGRKHGMSRTAEHRAWISMLNRCYRPNYKQFHLWGGRGIRVCDEWRKDFMAFYEHIGPRPSPQHSLDRWPDKDGNYEPGNVRWGTKSEQCFNRKEWIKSNSLIRQHRGYVESNQHVKPRRLLAEQLGVHVKVIHNIFRLIKEELHMARSPKKNTVRVDFTGVETQGVIPEGEFIAEVVKVTKEVKEDDESKEYLKWELAVAEGKHKSKKLYNNTSLQQQSLWATKRFLECLGVELEDGPLELDLEDMIGLQIGVVIEHHTWKGRPQSRVTDTYPVEAEATDDEPADSDESTSTSVVKESSSKKKATAPTLPTADDVNAMGKSELTALVETHDLDVELTGTTSAQRRAVIKALATKGTAKPEPEEDEESTIEEEIKAVEKKSTKKPKKVKIKIDDVQEADEDALTELIEAHELAVDLSEHATLRRKRSAVIDALEEAEMLEDEE